MDTSATARSAAPEVEQLADLGYAAAPGVVSPFLEWSARRHVIELDVAAALAVDPQVGVVAEQETRLVVGRHRGAALEQVKRLSDPVLEPHADRLVVARDTERLGRRADGEHADVREVAAGVADGLGDADHRRIVTPNAPVDVAVGSIKLDSGEVRRRGRGCGGALPDEHVAPPPALRRGGVLPPPPPAPHR